MASLRNGDTSVDVTRNESRNGDSGRRKRSENSCYLLAGGTSDIYSVTVNHDTGHFCKVDGGEVCKGNLFGKKGKYGAINVRDTGNPQAWCKHVQAVLANAEQIAEAQEITAVAFGKGSRRTVETGSTATVTVKPAVPAFDEPSVPERVVAEVDATDARERLASLEAEAATLRESLKAEELSGLREVVKGLLDKFDYDEIKDALKDVA